LLSRAAAKGLRGSGRYLDEWIRKGLLAPPAAPGLGRGQGGRAKGTWSEEQAEWFEQVAAGRVNKVPVPTLCSLPVFAWLVRGEEVVPLKQVRRAMATWASANRRAGWGAARATAREIVAELDHPAASPADRKRLADLVAYSAYQGHVDENVLLAAQRVFDPDGRGRWRGPSGMELTAEDYVSWVSRQLAIRAMLASPRQGDLISDEHFRSARLAFGAGLVRYRSAQEASIADPTISDRFPPLAPDDVATTACLGVSMLLEFALRSADLPAFREWVEEGRGLLGRFGDEEAFALGRADPGS